ncbi:uncharacterized protein LOC127879190 isoform X2 [Dreissena polymorpha]|uniref:uncharacterized protein LOC127879190 isoform X2 n=1 Tax=Dreissena polymorpha TaxID=45954 RepID=UPI002263FA0C|nr:uncharacterized protein LOC127879190 isoform X2 [Dreissena polymorpha]
MKLLLTGLLAVMLVWGPQTRAQKDGLTNDEILEAEARANKTSVGAAEKCADGCAEFKGEDFEKCKEECELEPSTQLAGDGDGADDRSIRKKRGFRFRIPRIPIPRIPIPIPRIPIPIPRIPIPMLRIPIPRIVVVGKKKRSVE